MEGKQKANNRETARGAKGKQSENIKHIAEVGIKGVSGEN